MLLRDLWIAMGRIHRASDAPQKIIFSAVPTPLCGAEAPLCHRPMSKGLKAAIESRLELDV